jgi:hypothetical protein
MTDPLSAAAGRCTALAEAVRDLAARVRDVARLIAESRLDDYGREWAERAALVHRALAREAAVADDLGGAIRRSVPEPGGLGPAPLPPPAAGPRGGRPRLGGTAAERVGSQLGPDLALLPDPDVPR